MAFVRHKMVKDKKYYQVVRNYREDGKHKQEVLCHLGVHSSLEAAIEAEKENIEQDQDLVSYWLEEARYTVASIRNTYGDEFGGEVPTTGQARARSGAVYREYDPYCSEEEWERWRERVQAAEELLRSTIYYHDARFWARWYETQTADHQARLDRLLEVRQKYF